MTPEEIAKLPYRPCVGVMLINADNHVFVGQRLDNDAPAWQMPQGGVDEGEAPRAAALRELWEETGVTEDKAQIIAETDGWIAYDLPHDIVPRIWKGRYRLRSVGHQAAAARPGLPDNCCRLLQEHS